MPTQLQGHCNCNAFQVTITDLDAGDGLEVCHCTDCRRFTGGLAEYLLIMPGNAVEINSESGAQPKKYAKKGNSGGEAVRWFCDTCGSPLYDSSGDKKFVHAGLFPPRSLPAPSLEIYTRNMEAWEVKYPNAKSLVAQ